MKSILSLPIILILTTCTKDISVKRSEITTFYKYIEGNTPVVCTGLQWWECESIDPVTGEGTNCIQTSFEVVSCEGGEQIPEGNAGGGAVVQTACCIEPGAKLVSAPTSEHVSDLCGQETSENKTCVHIWKCHTNTLGRYTWKYISSEGADLQKRNGVWKFKSKPTHQGHTSEGQIPPCVSSKFNINVMVPSLNSDSTTAQMNISYSVAVHVDCLPWNRPETINYNASSNWTAK